MSGVPIKRAYQHYARRIALMLQVFDEEELFTYVSLDEKARIAEAMVVHIEIGRGYGQIHIDDDCITKEGPSSDPRAQPPPPTGPPIVDNEASEEVDYKAIVDAALANNGLTGMQYADLCILVEELTDMKPDGTKHLRALVKRLAPPDIEAWMKKEGMI